MSTGSPAQAPDPAPRQATLPVRLATNVPVAMLLAVLLMAQLGILTTLRVPTANMTPALEVDDRVLVHSFGPEPEPGDILVYRSPLDYHRLLVGRVVGVPGNRVELGSDGLHIDGQPRGLDLGQSCTEAAGPTPPWCAEAVCEDNECVVGVESVGERVYFTRPAADLATLHFGPVEVPSGHVFVLSDNRVDRRDSRIFGTIPHQAVVGVASFVYYAQDEGGIRWDRIRRRPS